MRKALLPMVASLALCGAATGVLIATNASAQQSGHKPTMIALGTTSDQRLAAAPAEGGSPDALRGMRREQMCKNLYARKVGELAFLEAKLTLNTNQTPLFARWKQVSLDVAKQHQTDCSTRERRPQGQRLSVVDRLNLEEGLLKKRLTDIQTERPALTAFYNSLTPAQKEEFGRGEMHHMRGRMHMMLGMMDRHPGMGHGRMGRGPMEEPPPAPPPAQ